MNFYQYKQGKVLGRTRKFPNGFPYRVRTIKKGIFIEKNDNLRTPRIDEY